MRVHITLDDELVQELDSRVGSRRRSAFIARSVQRALEDERRWELIESAIGTIDEQGHEWDADPVTWVRRTRRGDARRVG